MGDNYVKITNSDQLEKVFEHAQDKLVVLMFYTKANSDCRRALSGFEKASCNHTISYFCLVDMDKFEGKSRYTNNVGNMPCFECYYMGNPFGTFIYKNDKDIEENVAVGQRYVMTQNNNKNNGGSSNNTQNQMSMMSQMTQAQPMTQMQIQQKILNNAQMQNPVYYQYLMQNPVALNNLVQQQMMQQQQLMQQQMMQQPMIQQPMMQPMNSMQQPMNSMQQPMNSMQNTMSNMMGQSMQNTMMPNMQQSSNIAGVLPTIQQMQQMFQIFQMMQQSGLINNPNVITEPNPTSNKQNIQTQVTNPSPTISSIPTNTIQQTSTNQQTVQTDSEANVIKLPNGDKLISLPGGKYGLVKKTA